MTSCIIYLLSYICHILDEKPYVSNVYLISRKGPGKGSSDSPWADWQNLDLGPLAWRECCFFSLATGRLNGRGTGQPPWQGNAVIGPQLDKVHALAKALDQVVERAQDNAARWPAWSPAPVRTAQAPGTRGPLQASRLQQF